MLERGRSKLVITLTSFLLRHNNIVAQKRPVRGEKGSSSPIRVIRHTETISESLVFFLFFQCSSIKDLVAVRTQYVLVV